MEWKGFKNVLRHCESSKKALRWCAFVVAKLVSRMNTGFYYIGSPRIRAIKHSDWFPASKLSACIILVGKWPQ